MSKPAIRPQRWTPPPVPPRAVQRQGPEPLPPLRVIELPGVGPEDVVVLPDGDVSTGLADGRVLRVDPASGACTLIADTGGRPAGLELLGDGRLLVCDAKRGLLAVDTATARIETWATEVACRPLVFTNNAAVAADGTVFFTDSSQRFGIDVWRADLIEHSRSGRLCRRDPDGSTEVLLDGMSFANGVAIAADHSWLVVAETGSYQLTRLWLKAESELA